MISEEDVVNMFNSGLDCSMIVLGEISDLIGISREDAYRFASLFGAGMLQDAVCGAVSGAYMAIGSKYGNSVPGDMAQKGIVMNKRDEFNRMFKEKFGSVFCPQLIGYRLSIPEEYLAASSSKVLSSKCPAFCIAAIEILKEIL